MNSGLWRGADALVAKDAPQLVHPLEAAHHQPLEVQLGGNAQGEGQIQGVVVRFKRPGIGTTRHALQHRRFDLEKVAFIKPATHGAHHAGPAPEGFAGLG